MTNRYKTRKNIKANGGQRRSKTKKIDIPGGQLGFTAFMLELVRIKNRDGIEIASGVLDKFSEKYELSDSENWFIRSLIKLNVK